MNTQKKNKKKKKEDLSPQKPRRTAQKYSYNLNIASGTKHNKKKTKKARNEIKGKFMIILIQEKIYGAKTTKKKITQIYLFLLFSFFLCLALTLSSSAGNLLRKILIFHSEAVNENLPLPSSV